MNEALTTDDDPIVVEARTYADRAFRDDQDGHLAYMQGVRFAVDKLRPLIPTGDYVLADDMSEETSRRWGKGLFCGFDDIKSVES